MRAIDFLPAIASGCSRAETAVLGLRAAKLIVTLICAAILPCVVCVSRADTTTFPLRDVAVSDVIDLQGNWQFRTDSGTTGITDSWFATNFDRSAWTNASVPGIWWEKPGKIRFPIYTGKGWYSRSVQIPANWTNTIVLAFLGSMHVTDVWVNGDYIGVHRGGYSPFFFEITPKIRPGTDVSIVVRVDNTVGQQTLPGGNMGWQNFGGIYREVYLLHQPSVRPEAIATSVSVAPDGQAVLKITGNFTNGTETAFNGTVSLDLLAKKRTVASTKIEIQISPKVNTALALELPVKKPHLWTPDDPFLHTLRIVWNSSGSQKMELRAGLREFRFEGSHFLLNNRRVWLQGFGTHEEYEGWGPCIPPDLRRSDLKLMKDVFRCNTLRPGHYPNHPILYDMCDEMGFIVFSEIPAWQIPNPFLESDLAWENWFKPQLTEMVTTLRNHTCIAMWGVANEIYDTRAYFRRALAYMKDLDSSRITTFVVASTCDLPITELTQIAARNFHYGWYHSEEVYALRDALIATEKQVGTKPIWVAEVGGLAGLGKLGGGYGDRSRGTETYLDKIIRFGVQYSPTQSDKVIGISVWTWNDFHRGNGIEAHGILSEGRIPKLSAYTVCNLFNGDLRVFVCETNSMCRLGGEWQASLRYFNPLEKEHKGLNVRWSILQKDKQVLSETLPFNVPSKRSGEFAAVKWAIPPDQSPGLYSFLVELCDSRGNWLHSNSSFFDVSQPSRPGVLSVKAQRDGKPVDQAWAVFSGFRIPIYPFVGLMIPLPEGQYEMEFHAKGAKPVKKVFAIALARMEKIEINF